ncbi:MAG: hypothetical protein ACI91Q_001209 [Gammaproteobacteria bacterium]|jgi:hypothetical protein
MLMMAALVVLPLLATVAHRLWRGARPARQRRRPLEVAGSAETAQERASLRAPRPRARTALLPYGEAIRTSVDWTVSLRSSLHLTSERASHGSSQGIAIHREPGDIEETYRPSGYGSWDSARPIPTGWAFVIFRPSKHLVSRTFPRRR